MWLCLDDAGLYIDYPDASFKSIVFLIGYILPNLEGHWGGGGGLGGRGRGMVRLFIVNMLTAL